MNRSLPVNTDAPTPLEEHSRALFDDSVANLDMRVRSRLTRVRHAALDAAANRGRRDWRIMRWTPAAGLTAAALAVVIWFGLPLRDHAPYPIDNRSGLEDLELVAATDEGSGDAMEMLQDDLEFYDWAADKAATPEAGSVG